MSETRRQTHVFGMKSAREVRAARAENVVFSFSLNMQIRDVLVAVAFVSLFGTQSLETQAFLWRNFKFTTSNLDLTGTLKL